MAYPAPHNVLVLIGSITSGSSTDVWQTGVRLGTGPGLAVSTDAASTAILDDIQGDLSTWWTAVRSLFAANVSFERFKFNAVDVNGHYISQTTTLQRDMPTTTQKGSGSSAALPAQLAVAVTLTTAASRGLASKGRMYLPSPASGSLNPSGGRILEASRNTLQTATATLLTNLGNWPGIDAAGSPGRPVVASKVREGAERPVTGVVVGDRFDVQRRRANRINEARPAVSAVS